MIRKIIAGTAVAGALTLGLAGIAGAATTTHRGLRRHPLGSSVRRAANDRGSDSEVRRAR